MYLRALLYDGANTLGRLRHRRQSLIGSHSRDRCVLTNPILYQTSVNLSSVLLSTFGVFCCSRESGRPEGFHRFNGRIVRHAVTVDQTGPGTGVLSALPGDGGFLKRLLKHPARSAAFTQSLSGQYPGWLTGQNIENLHRSRYDILLRHPHSPCGRRRSRLGSRCCGGVSAITHSPVPCPSASAAA